MLTPASESSAHDLISLPRSKMTQLPFSRHPHMYSSLQEQRLLQPMERRLGRDVEPPGKHTKQGPSIWPPAGTRPYHMLVGSNRGFRSRNSYFDRGNLFEGQNEDT